MHSADNSRKRILFFMDGYGNGGGIQEQCIRWISHLDADRFRVDVLAYNRTNGVKDDYPERLVSLGCDLYKVTPYANGGNLKKSLRETKVFFKEHHYDILHAHSSAKSIFVLREARKNGIPVRVLHSHAARVVTEQPFQAFMANALKGAVKRECTHMAACSTEAGRFLFGDSEVDKGNVHIIPNAIELDRFAYSETERRRVRSELGLSHSFILGHVGRFMPQKNHFFLIDIMEEVAKRRQDAHLILVGVGELQDQIKARVDDKGLGGHVTFLGLRDDVNRLVQAMDVFVMPSLFEGLPVSAVEAQASGLPCVLSDAITSEALLICGSVRVSLATPAAEWASVICSMVPSDRSCGFGVVSDRGFEISRATALLEDYWDEALVGVECQ